MQCRGKEGIGILFCFIEIILMENRYSDDICTNLLAVKWIKYAAEEVLRVKTNVIYKKLRNKRSTWNKRRDVKCQLV